MIVFVKAKIGIPFGIVVLASVSALTGGARRSAAQSYGSIAETFVNYSQFTRMGGNNVTSATTQAATVGVATAGLNPNTLAAQAYYINGISETSASAIIYDTITTGNVPSGSTMTVTIDEPTLEIQQGVYTGLDQSAGVRLDVYQGTSAYGNDYALASESAGAKGSQFYGYGSYTTPGYDPTVVNSPDLVSVSNYPYALSTSFYVNSNSSYFFELSAGATISEESGYSYINYGSVTTSIDPTWSVSTSPGVAYTTASGIPIGGNASPAPEPSALLLLAPGMLGLLAVRRRRVG